MISRKLLQVCFTQRCSSYIERNLLHCNACLQCESSTEQAEEGRKSDYEAELQKRRNKSNLEPQHYNRIHGLCPPMSEDEMLVASVAELRERYGRHGAQSGVDPRCLWPSTKELALMQEWEQTGYPLSLLDMQAKARQGFEDSVYFIVESQRTMRGNMAQLDGWKKDITNRVAQKEDAARLAKEKRETIIEEVRQMLGVRLDPRGEKFQEAVEKKEQEEKRAAKALKKRLHQEKLLNQMKKIAEDEAAAAAAQEESPQGGAEPAKPAEPAKDVP